MSAAQVSLVYRQIIEEVINNIRAEFLQEGYNEEALILLQRRWEQKLLNTGALAATSLSQNTTTSNTLNTTEPNLNYHHSYSLQDPQPIYFTTHDPNFANQTSSAELLLSLNPTMTYQTTPRYSGLPQMTLPLPPNPNVQAPDFDLLQGRPQQFMPPSNFLDQTGNPTGNVTVNVLPPTYVRSAPLIRNHNLDHQST